MGYKKRFGKELFEAAECYAFERMAKQRAQKIRAKGYKARIQKLNCGWMVFKGGKRRRKNTTILLM